MTTQPSSHLHAEFQHHSSHQFLNVQSVSLQEWGSVTARERGEDGERGFSKNEESEPSPGTVHLTLPHTELWVDPVQLDGSGIWNLATYRVLCNSQYSSVRYLTPQSPAGWVRGRGLLRLEAGVESFMRSVVVGFTRFKAWMTALANTALCRIGGRREGGKEESWGLKQRWSISKIHLCRLSRMTDRYRENTVLNNKSKYNSKHSLTHTPIKQPNKKTKQNGKQVNQTKVTSGLSKVTSSFSF